MPKATELEQAIADALYPIKAYDLSDVCTSFGLKPPDGDDPFTSKNGYVLRRLKPLSEDQLIEVARKVQARYPFYALEEILALRERPAHPISELTRRHILDTVLGLGNLSGKLELSEFLSRVWPLEQLPSSDLRFKTFMDNLFQHTVQNDDWTQGQVLESLNVLKVSQQRFERFLELIVSPLVRVGEEQEQFVREINLHLLKDKLRLRAVEEISGYPVYRVMPAAAGVSGSAKNLIFAADGPKPEIVLADAINNDIRIVKNEEFCLVYDRAIPDSGLLWRDLIQWWADQTRRDAGDSDVERQLYRRLHKSLGSQPERDLFRAYFESFRERLGDALPALIPQVYLHYDPYTLRQLAGEARLPRQRMDFLFLFSNYERIVLEVDGPQHYSEAGRADPEKYAEMLAEDRRLRLLGYEVYRFATAELSGGGMPALGAFLERLLKKHNRFSTA